MPAATTSRGFSMIVADQRAACARRAPLTGTTRLTRPQSRAVGASMNSPVNSISNARLRDDVARHRHAGRRAEQPEVDARRREPRIVDATARSHAATSWQPAAVATPCTLRDHRLRQRAASSASRRQQRREQVADERFVASSRASPSDRGPGRTRGPLPATTTTRTVVSAAIASSAACSASSIAHRDRVELRAGGSASASRRRRRRCA